MRKSNGIRCCYHGWLFAPDGEILETPAEDQTARAVEMVKERTRLGAYPVIEYRGLIFAYMGPPEKQPEFPVYDAFIYEDQTSAVYKAPYTCNWIQVLDAILDPTHTTYLHSQNSHPQFSDGMKKDGVLKFYERHENHFLGSSTRRIGDNAWVRVNELVLPNFTQAGSAYAADGSEQRYFGRSCFTRWVVPVDDENSIVYAWANFGDRWDPHEYNTKEGHEMIEQGEVLDRSPEEKKALSGGFRGGRGHGPHLDPQGREPDADRPGHFALPPPRPQSRARSGRRDRAAPTHQARRSLDPHLWTGYGSDTAGRKKARTIKPI